MITRRALFALCSAAVALSACDAGSTQAKPVSPVEPSRPVVRRSDARGELFQRMIDADRASPPQSCAVVLAGSSSIAQWSSFAEDLAPHYVLQRGVGGATIKDLQRYLPELLKPLKPAALVLYIGENDIAMRGRVARTFSRYKEVVAQAVEALPETPIYLVSIKHSPARARRADQVSQFNELIEDHARTSPQLHYIDVTRPMQEAGPVEQLYRSDRQHLSDRGYAVWRKAIGPAIKDRAPSCRS